jgi:hypothetical protein
MIGLNIRDLYRCVYVSQYTHEIFGRMQLASHLGINLEGYLDSDKT